MRIRFLLLLALCLLPLPALATCDPVPVEVAQVIQADEDLGEMTDYITLTAADGCRYGYALLQGYESIVHFREKEGKMVRSSFGCTLLPDTGKPAYFRRVDDGTFTAYRAGEAITCAIGPERDGWHSLTTVGWEKDGYTAVLAEGTLTYSQNGRVTAVIPVPADFAVEDDYEYGLPESPEQAQAMAQCTREAVAEAHPGWRLCEYYNYNRNQYASATYISLNDLQNDCLTVRWVELNAMNRSLITTESYSMTMPLPADLAEQMLTAGTEDLLNLTEGYMYESGSEAAGYLLKSGSTAVWSFLPPGSRVVQYDLQSHGLIVLTEDASGVRILRDVIWEHPDAAPVIRTSQPLPSDASLDLFHAGNDNIQLGWNGGETSCSFRRAADGQWYLEWVTGEDTYTVTVLGLQGYVDSEEKRYPCYAWGDFAWQNPFDCDLRTLPRTFAEACAQVDQTGWAIVNNPDPADRLHLRASPSRSAKSLGKFYNGTPVRVLEEQGDWAKVEIGLDGRFTGWMMKQYLLPGGMVTTFDTAFPQLCLREEYEGSSRVARQNTADYYIIGLLESEQGNQYILLGGDGVTEYVPAHWLYAGNG